MHVSLFSPGAGASAAQPWVIHVPGFAEEMNKSRAMVSMQARAMARKGMIVAVPDLLGTGDSAGSLKNATWADWQDDISYSVLWARKQGATRITLWGHRFGCLLAADIVQLGKIQVDQLLFWQPVHSGKQQMSQFLRLRLASGLTSGSAETAAQLREQLKVEGELEVAGYTFSRALFNVIESLVLSQMAVPVDVPVEIFEVASEPANSVLPVTAKLVDQWSEAGIDCNANVAQGAPFWMTQELGFSPELVNKTLSFLTATNPLDGIKHIENDGPLSRDLRSMIRIPSSAEGDPLAVVFDCEGEQLAGVFHPSKSSSKLGVLIVVGGPQYRVGSHRQFVKLAEQLARDGLPVLRFDYRGMGDSSGTLRGFTDIDADIRCAIDALQREDPEITQVAIWGLCDAATAAVFYAASDPRVSGLVLVNPWVYSDQGAARAYLKSYYLRRLFQRDFWEKIFSGGFSVVASAKSLWSMLNNSVFGAKNKSEAMQEDLHEPQKCPAFGADPDAHRTLEQPDDLVLRFSATLAQFSGKVFFILSGNDLTATEFIDATQRNHKLKHLMTLENIIGWEVLPTADHTFSRGRWRAEVEGLSSNALMNMRK